MSDQQQTTLCGDPDQDADTGIFFDRNFYRCGIGKLYEFCRQLEKCSTNSYETFSTTGWDDVSPIDLVLLRITFQIREF